jgi:hypothetical protein
MSLAEGGSATPAPGAATVVGGAALVLATGWAVGVAPGSAGDGPPGVRPDVVASGAGGPPVHPTASTAASRAATRTTAGGVPLRLRLPAGSGDEDMDGLLAG